MSEPGRDLRLPKHTRITGPAREKLAAQLARRYEMGATLRTLMRTLAGPTAGAPR